MGKGCQKGWYYQMRTNNKNIAQSILRDGQITSLTRVQGIITEVVVKAFNQTYKIINPYGSRPKITQL